VLPADGDADNAASVAQAFKVLADFISWLTDKFAISGSWAQRIERWRNAKLQTRFLVDHPGFPAGKILQWNEGWDDVAMLTAKSAVGNGAWAGRWFYSISGDAAGGVIQGNGATAGAPTFGGGPVSPSNIRTSNIYLATDPHGTALSIQEVETAQQVIIDDDTCFTLQWDATILPSSAGSPVDDNFMGIVVGTLLGSTGDFASNLLPGVGFLLGAGQTTYHTYELQTGAGGPTVIDTGIARSGDRDRFRIEYYGPNVSDTSTAVAKLYINEVAVTGLLPVFTLTGAAPLGPATVTVAFRHADAASLTWMNVQETDFRANIWPGDVAF